MTLNPPSDKSGQRDWRGLLLVLVALLVYQIGPFRTHLEPKNNLSNGVDWPIPVAPVGVGANSGIDPRQAIFMMQPIDLNRADAEVLASLKGIGPALAARIIDYRDQHGGFSQVGDITEVHGIGPKKLAGFLGDVMVGKSGE